MHGTAHREALLGIDLPDGYGRGLDDAARFWVEWHGLAAAAVRMKWSDSASTAGHSFREAADFLRMTRDDLVGVLLDELIDRGLVFLDPRVKANPTAVSFVKGVLVRLTKRLYRERFAAGRPVALDAVDHETAEFAAESGDLDALPGSPGYATPRPIGGRGHYQLDSREDRLFADTRPPVPLVDATDGASGLWDARFWEFAEDGEPVLRVDANADVREGRRTIEDLPDEDPMAFFKVFNSWATCGVHRGTEYGVRLHRDRGEGVCEVCAGWVKPVQPMLECPQCGGEFERLAGNAGSRHTYCGEGCRKAASNARRRERYLETKTTKTAATSATAIDGEMAR